MLRECLWLFLNKKSWVKGSGYHLENKHSANSGTNVYKKIFKYIYSFIIETKKMVYCSHRG